jgi:hypothetical protein
LPARAVCDCDHPHLGRLRSHHLLQATLVENISGSSFDLNRRRFLKIVERAGDDFTDVPTICAISSCVSVTRTVVRDPAFLPRA